MYFQDLITLFIGVVLAASAANTSLLPNQGNYVENKLSLYNNDVDFGKYLVNYKVDMDKKVITFEVTAETTGFIGFGLSPGKGMDGADMIIGGVFPNGTVYFSDRYGVPKGEPKIDDEPNWEPLKGSENATHTFLQFSRPLDTCDKNHDVAITGDTVSIIWSYGETDDIKYHGTVNRGSKDVSLLYPTLDIDVSKFDVWTVNTTMLMPASTTSYWCTIHKAPVFKEKRHVVGFDTILKTPEALKHAHHLDMYQCFAPPGEDIDKIFGPLVGHKGEECTRTKEIPLHLCQVLFHNWAIGGKGMLLPENAGYSLVEGNESVYMMFEIHYDNPDGLSNVTFDTAVEIYHTTKIRPQEAAMLLVAHAVTYSQMIPGNTKEFITTGHCGSACTKRKLKPEGISLFNVLHHAHLAGRKLKLRQFRDGKELPWISVDNNYAFDYQQNQPLREHRQVLPGDHLTLECTYGTTGKKDVTLGGLSTNEEMCQGIIWYYPKSDLRFCESAFPEKTLEEYFGIEEVTWPNMIELPIVTKPEPFRNKTLVEVLTTTVDWTPTKVAELQKKLQTENHFQASCVKDYTETSKNNYKDNTLTNRADKEYVNYPTYDKAYVPQDTCKGGGDNGGANNLFPASILIFIAVTLIATIFKL